MGFEPDPLPNWDLVGRCFDVLKVDPLDPARGAMYPAALQLGEQVPVPDETATRPEYTDYLPLTGGRTSQTTIEISSVYDFQRSSTTSGSVTVSDPAGAAFSATLSASFEQTSKDTQSRQALVTSSTYQVSRFKLAVADAPEITLADDLAKALRTVGDEGEDAYESFFATFGTHYAHEVWFGGLATQRIVVGRQDYEHLTRQGVDVKAAAEATFELAKARGSGEHGEKVDRRLSGASSVSVDHIVYAGGEPQDMFGLWAQTVRTSPGAIAVSLRPLYELVTARHLPGVADIADRRAALSAATNSYLASHGHDLAKSVLRSGEQVVLTLAMPGRPRRLAPRKSYAGTVHDGTGLPATTWRVSTTRRAAAELVTGDSVTLTANDGRVLDAQAGHDDVYDPGSGLTGLVAAPGEASTWVLEFPETAPTRREVVDGDVVRLCVRGPHGDSDDGGHLLAEPDADAVGQRVYSFGKPWQEGTSWLIQRADSAPTST